LTVPQDNDNDWFTAATFSPDGQTLLTSRSDGTLQLRNIQMGTVQSEAPWRFSGYGILAFTADGQALIDASGQGGDFRIYLWDFQRRQAPRNIGGTWVTSPAMMAVTPDGYTLAAGSNNGTTRIWNIRTGQVLSTLPAGATIAASSIALTPDGQTLLVSYGDGSVKQWSTRTGRLNRVLFPAGRYGEQAIAISPNGQILAMNFGNSIRLWNLQTNRLIANLPANVATNKHVMAFSPDSRFLLNTDGDGSRIRVWQLN
jgi:WD40 repeat protein